MPFTNRVPLLYLSAVVIDICHGIRFFFLNVDMKVRHCCTQGCRIYRIQCPAVNENGGFFFSSCDYHYHFVSDPSKYYIYALRS